MNRNSLIGLGIASLLLAGCGSGGDSGSEPSGPSQTTITTQLSNSGLVQSWPNATVSGGLTSFPAPCDQSTDEYCLEEFGGVTDIQGNYTLVTDAIPADWSIAATQEAGSVDCPTGATWSGNLTPLQGAQLICNQFSQGSAVATPNNCTITIDENPGGGTTSNCPATVTVTTSGSGRTLPAGRALSVGEYNDLASEEYSGSSTASSSTTIVVPRPNAVGENAIIIVDPTTNQIVATAAFVVRRTIILPGK